MKNLYYLIGICFLFHSCATTTTIYQISRVQSNNTFVKNNRYVYKDTNFIINYNLWSNGGIMNFQIYNRTDTPIYIDWSKSNFILNDKSSDYWNDVTTTKTNGTSLSTKYNTWYAVFNNFTHTSNTIGAYSSISIHEREKPNNQIPPKAYLTIDRFYVGSPFWTMPTYPKENDSMCYNFSDTNSVWKFRNYIAYTKNQDLSNVKFIDNSFWVNKLVNLNGDKYISVYIPNSIDSFSSQNKKPNAFYTANDVDANNIPTGGQHGNSAGLFIGLALLLFLTGVIIVATSKH